VSQSTATRAANQVGGQAQRLRSPFAEFARRFVKQRAALTAGLVIVLLVLVGIFAPLLAPYDPMSSDYDNVLEGPSRTHLAGTDEFGRDIFSRILWGARISLRVGFTAVLVGSVCGILLGLVAGYYGRLADMFVTRLADLLLAFPGILLAIGIVAVLGPGIENVIIAVSIFSVPTFVRLVRGSTLVLKETAYVEAARSINAPSRTILLRHILPGTISSVIVYFTLRMGTAIITASSLSFIGLGAPVESPEWGAMLSRARDYLATAPHYAIGPSVAIFVTVLAFNILGDGLRDAVDPKLDER
jgi:glutathione transport system permease protein